MMRKGDFNQIKRRYDARGSLCYASLDVIGWDGYNFPYGFSIHNFEPITGRIHQPPPANKHLRPFVVFSFVLRLYDYLQNHSSAPNNHSNIDSDGAYYVDGDYVISTISSKIISLCTKQYSARSSTRAIEVA
jgi:homogentisate 1,2-dioxygenase